MKPRAKQMKIKQVILCYFGVYKNRVFLVCFLKNHIAGLFLLLVLSLASERLFIPLQQMKRL